jgi:hypothetical protein
MGFSPLQDPPLVGKSGVGVEKFVDFSLHVENLTRYHVPSHPTPMCYTNILKMKTYKKTKIKTYAYESWKLTEIERK